MSFRGAIIDVDGTVVRGDEPIPGASAGIEAIRDAGLRRLFVSNNPTAPPSEYVDRLGRAGVTVAPEEVLTAGVVTREYLRANYPEASIYLVGEPGLESLLADADLSLTADHDAADVVVVSLDREFDYDALTHAYWALSDDGVDFVGTDPDVVIPSEDRPIPGSGAVINAVAGVAEREPDVVLGKPSAFAREMALERLGVSAADCLVVGDRLDTDIAFGADAGMTTVLVRTGVTDLALEEIPPEHRPDYVVDSLGDIEAVLER